MNGETRDSGEAPGAAEIVAGGEFAGHRIVAELGRGGMGVVYRAHDPVLDRDRALKVIVPALSADPRFRERFRRESRLAAQVDHPNLIPIYRAGEEAGQLFLVMRLVEGVDLRSGVAENGPLAPPRSARIVAEVGAALDAAHARGLVHRDVKPANVLIESTDGAERVFLTDFGISRSATGSGTITGSGEVMGSLDYVAPEQLEGAEVDRRADIYSLGCVAFFALTGEPPFPRDSDVAKMYAHVNAPRPCASELVPNLTAAIDEVIARALAVEPDRRPATAGEFGADLEEAIAGVHEATTTRVPRRRARARPAGKPGRRPGGRRGRLAIAGIIVVAIAAAAIVATSGGGAPSQPQVVATIDVGGGPNGVSVGPHLVWVAAHAAGEVVAIDPHSNRPIGSPIEVGGHPSSVAVAFGSVWVTDSSSGTLIRIERHRIVQRIRVGSHPSDVVAANGFVWVANEASNSVNRIDPFGDSPSVSATVAVGGGPHALAIGDRGVWVASIRNGTVSEIDPRHATTEGRPIPAGRGPSDIAAGPDVIWVIDNVSGTLIRIDPKTRTASRPTPVGQRPRGLKQGLGYLWVANGGDGTVWRLEQETGARVGDPIEVGSNPADVSIGDGSIWTADYGGGSVTRIKP